MESTQQWYDNNNNNNRNLMSPYSHIEIFLKTFVIWLINLLD
jgi:hypothetical protein